MIKRLAATLGIVVFFVLAGTAAGYAYWSASAEVTTSATLGTPAACSAETKLVNGGFESPNISPETITTALRPTTVGGTVPGWEIVGTASRIEFWRGYNDPQAAPIVVPGGAQFLELNGNGANTMYQDVSVEPGQVLSWSLMHRGRWGSDTMRVAIYPSNSSLTTSSYQVPTGQTDADIVTSKAAFKRYSGTYTVPTNYNSAVKLRFALVPRSTSNGDNTVGNLIDDVFFGASSACLDATSTIENANGSTQLTPTDMALVTTTITNTAGVADGAVLTLPISPTLGTPTSVTIDGSDAGARWNMSASDPSTLVVRIGSGANGSAGGRVSSGASIVVRYVAPVTGAVDQQVSTTPTVAFTDAEYPGWTLKKSGPTVTATIVEDTTPPDAPTGLTAVATGETTVNLTWVASASSDVDHYVIERVSSRGSWGEVSFTMTGATTATDSTAQPGQAYAYRVYAIDTAGLKSAASNVAVTLTAFGTHNYRAAWLNGGTDVCVEASSTTSASAILRNSGSCTNATVWNVIASGAGVQPVLATNHERGWMLNATCTWEIFNYCLGDWVPGDAVSVVSRHRSQDVTSWLAAPYFNGSNAVIRMQANSRLLSATSGNGNQLRVQSAEASAAQLYFTKVS